MRSQLAPPPGSWLAKHGKTLAYGLALGGGVAVVGGLVYWFYSTIEGSTNPPPVDATLCEQLSAELGSGTATGTLFYEVGLVNTQILNQGGAPTAAQTATLQGLQNQIVQIEAQMAQYCAPSAPTPGETADNFFKQVEGYAAIGAAVLIFTAVGIATGIATAIVVARVYPYLRKYIRSKKNPINFPESVEDTEVSDSFSSATFGQIISQAYGIAQVANNPAVAQNVSNALRAQLVNDPVIAQSQVQAEYFTTLADAATEVELADTYAGIASLYTEAVADGADTLDAALSEIDLLA